MKTLAERLAEARNDRTLSQAALAKLAGCGQSTIASIERGRNQGSTVLPRLAEVLGVYALWLAEGRGPKKAEPARSAALQATESAAASYRSTTQVTQVAEFQSWPFKRIELSRLRSLPADEQAFIEGQLLAAIKDAEARVKKGAASNGA